MLNDEELEDLLFAIRSLLKGNGLTPSGIKKYKDLEQTLLNTKRGAHPTQRALDSATYERDGLLFCKNCGSGMGAVEDEPLSQ